MVKEYLWVKERILPKVYRKPTVPRTQEGPRSPRHRPTGNSHTAGHAQLPGKEYAAVFFVKKNNDVGMENS